MTLNELFKNTSYDDTLFSDEAKQSVEAQIIMKTVRGAEVPYIKCAIRDKEIRLTPEEAVRQLYLHKLLNDYGYTAARIQLEVPIHFGREVKRADIAVMDKDRPMVPYIIVELKKPKLTDGKEQLKSYCNATGAPIGVWTNGEQISCYNRKDPNFFEEISDIPKAAQKLSDILNEKYTYNESIKKEIDLRPLISATVEKHRYKNLIINEIQFMHDFYDAVMVEVSGILRHYLDETLPKKEFNQTVTGKIKDACLRLNSALRLRFEYNYRYPHEVDALVAPDSYAIIYQIPFNGFGRVGSENLYTLHIGEYSPLIATKAVNWFASYVYALRNALFHEIISPLDEEWQMIFKSAYLLLKQISDICISCISQIEEFPKTQENAVFKYAEEHHKKHFDYLATHVELLDFPKMVLKNWKVERGQIVLKGWFLAKLKLQQGDAADIQNRFGLITEEDKGFDFQVTLDENFEIAKDRDSHVEIIEIRLQNGT